MPIRVLLPHPLLDGLGQKPVFFHQIIAHKKMPLFGVQFHPERYDETHPDGQKIFENFFNISKAWSLCDDLPANQHRPLLAH